MCGTRCGACMLWLPGEAWGDGGSVCQAQGNVIEDVNPTYEVQVRSAVSRGWRRGNAVARRCDDER